MPFFFLSPVLSFVVISLVRGAESSGVWFASWLDQRIVRLITVFGSARWGFPSLQMDLRSMMKECAMKEGSGPISDPNVRLMLLTKGVEHRRRFPTDWLVRTAIPCALNISANSESEGLCRGSKESPNQGATFMSATIFPPRSANLDKFRSLFGPQSRDLPRW